jgi:hypothetical protein
MDDIDIWRTVNEMLELYGDGAEFKTQLRADKRSELGDVDVSMFGSHPSG